MKESDKSTFYRVAVILGVFLGILAVAYLFGAFN